MWEAVEACATTVLVVVGTWQIFVIKEQAKRERTLNAVTLYSSDPVLDASARTLRKAQNSGDFSKAPKDYRSDVVTILNFLDFIAIGIEQKLYVEPIAKDHLKQIVLDHCRDYLSESLLNSIGNIGLRDYPCLEKMYNRWRQESVTFQG